MIRDFCQASPDNPEVSFTIDDIVYPAGATLFEILEAGMDAAIDGAGIIYVPSNDIPLGVYAITIKYAVGEVYYQDVVLFAITDCYDTLLEDEFIFCGLGGSEQTQQLQFSSGTPISDWEIDIPVDGITISTTGLMTIVTDVFTSGVVTFTYNHATETKSVTVSIEIVDCVNPEHTAFTECEKEPIGIVWVNQSGGRQGYYFNQPKDYTTDQEGEESWDNQSRERRYFTRGRVSDAIQITQENIPKEHLTSLASLKNSIQAWVCTDMLDRSTYEAILLVPGDFFKRRTSDRFYSFTFKFNYAIPKLIQRQ